VLFRAGASDATGSVSPVGEAVAAADSEREAGIRGLTLVARQRVGADQMFAFRQPLVHVAQVPHAGCAPGKP